MEGTDFGGVIDQYIINKRNEMFTSIPCVIVGRPDLKRQRIDVRILVNKITTDDEIRELPPILDVPLVFPGSRTSQFSFPVSEGDTVLCVFSQRSIDRFKLGSDQPASPMDFSKYSKKDAVAIPGLFTFPDARNDPSKRSLSHNVDDTVMTHNIGTNAECELRLTKDGNVIINAPGNDVTVNCDNSTINSSSSSTVNTSTATVNADEFNVNAPTSNFSGNVNIEGNTSVSGNLGVSGQGTLGSATINGINFTSHRHTGVQSGSDTSDGAV